MKIADDDDLCTPRLNKKLLEPKTQRTTDVLGGALQTNVSRQQLEAFFKEISMSVVLINKKMSAVSSLTTS